MGHAIHLLQATLGQKKTYLLIPVAFEFENCCFRLGGILNKYH